MAAADWFRGGHCFIKKLWFFDDEGFRPSGCHFASLNSQWLHAARRKCRLQTPLLIGRPARFLPRKRALASAPGGGWQGNLCYAKLSAAPRMSLRRITCGGLRPSWTSRRIVGIVWPPQTSSAAAMFLAGWPFVTGESHARLSPCGPRWPRGRHRAHRWCPPAQQRCRRLLRSGRRPG